MSVISKDTKDLIVGLDIGTSKVVALVAELNPDGQFNVQVITQLDSPGITRGEIQSFDCCLPWLKPEI